MIHALATFRYPDGRAYVNSAAYRTALSAGGGGGRTDDSQFRLIDWGAKRQHAFLYPTLIFMSGLST